MSIEKIRAAVVGLGNIGQYALNALEVADDFEIAGIVRRQVNADEAKKLGYPVVASIDALEKVDVAILCTPTRTISETAQALLRKGIHTVDSFDIHSGIVELRRTLDQAAKQGNASAIIASGWDPGSDSIIRTLMLAMAPKGITYTNFGPGMSMGHTVAVKAIDGVKAALSMTIPLGTGVHRRMVYIELQDGADFETVAKAIKTDAYFASDETHVKQVPSVEALQDVGHGVHMVRKGVSGLTANQIFEFNMTINNPALTAQFLIASARAVVKQKPGAYTVIEIPPVHFLPGNLDELIYQLV